ncbi:MAG: CAAD domain-containing protein [Synechococcaceae cyanobacterium]
MSETSSTTADQGMADQGLNPGGAGDPATVEATAAVQASLNAEVGGEPVASFSERYSEVLGRVNELLDQVDWSQMGRIGKAVGILLVVIVAQVLIKGVLDTINLLPIVPGLLELLGLVVVGHWSWQNLTTSEKRQAVLNRLQTLRSEYLG